MMPEPATKIVADAQVVPTRHSIHKDCTAALHDECDTDHCHECGAELEFVPGSLVENDAGPASTTRFALDCPHNIG